MKKSVVRQVSYKNFLAKFLYDNIFQKFLSQAMAFMMAKPEISRKAPENAGLCIV